MSFKRRKKKIPQTPYNPFVVEIKHRPVYPNLYKNKRNSCSQKKEKKSPEKEDGRIEGFLEGIFLQKQSFLRKFEKPRCLRLRFSLYWLLMCRDDNGADTVFE